MAPRAAHELRTLYQHEDPAYVSAEGENLKRVEFNYDVHLTLPNDEIVFMRKTGRIYLRSIVFEELDIHGRYGYTAMLKAVWTDATRVFKHFIQTTPNYMDRFYTDIYVREHEETVNGEESGKFELDSGWREMPAEE